MVHGILQFTPSIAFRYVLHRCESRDIRCRESFVFKEQRASPRTIRERGARGGLPILVFLGAFRAGVRSLAPKNERASAQVGGGREARDERASPPSVLNVFAGRAALQVSTMILPQVHLRKPCYDFSFL